MRVLERDMVLHRVLSGIQTTNYMYIRSGEDSEHFSLSVWSNDEEPTM